MRYGLTAWYDVCLYVAGADKNDRQGASRKDRVMAATGKSGSAAKQDALRKGAAGDVLSYLQQSSNNVVTRFDAEENKTSHLSEIYRLPEGAWADAVAYLLNNNLSAKRIGNEVKQILELLKKVPDWWQLDESVLDAVSGERFTSAAWRSLIAPWR